VEKEREGRDGRRGDPMAPRGDKVAKRRRAQSCVWVAGVCVAVRACPRREV